MPIILPPKGVVKGISGRKKGARRKPRGRKKKLLEEFLATENAEIKL
jgi:hypothetical protein